MHNQIVINTIIAASSYILVGISFYITFSVAKFFHFTYGAFFTLGAYITYSLVNITGIHFIVSTVLAIILLSLIAMCMDQFVFRMIRNSTEGGYILLLASLGLYLVIQNAISNIYGDSALLILDTNHKAIFNILGGRITLTQVLQIALAVTMLLVTWFLIRHTPLGRYMRAVGYDKNLSLSLGIPIEKYISLSFAIGYGIAAIAGVVAAMNVDITPTMGMRPMMMGMVVMIIGGNSILGIACCACLIAAAQHFGMIWLSTQWQDAIAFIILVVFLFFKPEGFFGKKSEKSFV